VGQRLTHRSIFGGAESIRTHAGVSKIKTEQRPTLGKDRLIVLYHTLSIVSTTEQISRTFFLDKAARPDISLPCSTHIPKNRCELNEAVFSLKTMAKSYTAIGEIERRLSPQVSITTEKADDKFAFLITFGRIFAADMPQDCGLKPTANLEVRRYTKKDEVVFELFLWVAERLCLSVSNWNGNISDWIYHLRKQVEVPA